MARRSGYLIRVHDPKAVVLREFRGVPAYDPDPAWLLTGHFEPFDERVGELAVEAFCQISVIGETGEWIGHRVRSQIRLSIDDGGERWESLSLDVQAGSLLDFVVDPRESNDWCDSTEIRAVIY